MKYVLFVVDAAAENYQIVRTRSASDLADSRFSVGFYDFTGDVASYVARTDNAAGWEGVAWKSLEEKPPYIDEVKIHARILDDLRRKHVVFRVSENGWHFYKSQPLHNTLPTKLSAQSGFIFEGIQEEVHVFHMTEDTTYYWALCAPGQVPHNCAPHVNRITPKEVRDALLRRLPAFRGEGYAPARHDAVTQELHRVESSPAPVEKAYPFAIFREAPGAKRETWVRVSTVVIADVALEEDGSCSMKLTLNTGETLTVPRLPQKEMARFRAALQEES